MSSSDRAPRILGLSEGNHRTALSGVAGYLFDALERQVGSVQRLDYAPRGIRRFGVAAATFSPSRSVWRSRFHTSAQAHGVLSRTLAQQVRAQIEPWDVSVQVHGYVSNQPLPYTLYIDQTMLMAERGWPSWTPMAGKERTKVLALEGAMYAGAAHLFTMGEPGRDSLLQDYGLDGGRMTVVGGGLNLNRLPPARPPAHEPVILFVGREFERKGGEDLLSAFEIVRREIPQATLHIVGPKRGVRHPGVVSHGKLSHRSELVGLYKRARVFCMPSLYEPWGLVFAEAMAYSVPCVGSTVQSIPEILDHGTAGVLVKPSDPKGLAEVLIRLLGDDQLTARISEAGRRWVESFHSWDLVAGRMAPALRRIAGC